MCHSYPSAPFLSNGVGDIAHFGALGVPFWRHPACVAAPALRRGVVWRRRTLGCMTATSEEVEKVFNPDGPTVALVDSAERGDRGVVG